jgi:uncharacterized Ntn-hydrolase superfamily protein
VAARCAHARAGVGVVATQNITDPRLGPRGLDLMASGQSATQALAELRASTRDIEFRQLTLIDRDGVTASFSGQRTLGTHGVAAGKDAIAAGNLLANPGVPDRMLAAFTADPSADLGDRLMAALAAGLAAGGEAGQVHSAGLLVVRDLSWPIVDLRIDWHETDPIGALAATWDVYKPQLEDYVTRALNPSGAPSYGVPGDEG